MLTRDGLTVTSFVANGLEAEASGKLSYSDWRKLHIEGSVKLLDVHRAASVFTDRTLPWNGTLQGIFSLDTTRGRPDTVLTANADVVPAAEGNPIQGLVEMKYDQEADTIEARPVAPQHVRHATGRFGNSWPRSQH